MPPEGRESSFLSVPEHTIPGRIPAGLGHPRCPLQSLSTTPRPGGHYKSDSGGDAGIGGQFTQRRGVRAGGMRRPPRAARPAHGPVGESVLPWGRMMNTQAPHCTDGETEVGEPKKEGSAPGLNLDVSRVHPVLPLRLSAPGTSPHRRADRP